MCIYEKADGSIVYNAFFDPQRSIRSYEIPRGTLSTYIKVLKYFSLFAFLGLISCILILIFGPFFNYRNFLSVFVVFELIVAGFAVFAAFYTRKFLTIDAREMHLSVCRGESLVVRTFFCSISSSLIFVFAYIIFNYNLDGISALLSIFILSVVVAISAGQLVSIIRLIRR